MVGTTALSKPGLSSFKRAATAFTCSAADRAATTRSQADTSADRVAAFVGGRRLLADPHDLAAVLRDVHQFLPHELAVLARFDGVATRLQADFPDPRSRDHDVRPLDLDADSGVIDFDDQRAFRREQANDRAVEIGDAGRFREAQASEEQHEYGRDDRPATVEESRPSNRPRGFRDLPAHGGAFTSADLGTSGTAGMFPGPWSSARRRASRSATSGPR